MRKPLLWSFALGLSLAVPAFAQQADTAQTSQAKTSHTQTSQAKTSQAKTAPSTPVNLNSASQAELEALPGVGKATATKIIAGRPYASVDDLAKAGVSKSTIAKISSMVTVGAAAPAAPNPAPAQPATPAPPSGAAASPGSPSAPARTPPARTAPAPASTAPSATTPQQPPVKGMVWVNLSTKVYHKEGDRYYGNTKHGKFMTEEDAIKAGYREAKTPGKSKGKS